MDLIKAAIHSERIPPEREGHYRRLFGRDPEGTKRLLARLEPVPGLAAPQPTDARGQIASSAGLAVTPHPSGGYYVAERS